MHDDKSYMQKTHKSQKPKPRPTRPQRQLVQLTANPVILLLNRRVVAGGNPQLALVGVHLAVGATHGSEAKLTHIPTARGTAISVPNRRGSGGCRGDWNWNWSWSWSWS